MRLIAHLRHLRTPEFIESSGGLLWWSFFIAVPALIVIFGQIDPIFDAFLSLFSVDKAGHIVTSWEVKYGLFLLFCLLVISIYLLIRLNPARLKRKAEKAYGLITHEVSRIYAQTYESPTPRHNLGKLHQVYRIDGKYTMKCECKIVLIAKEDLHFWKYSIGAEAEGDGQDFISDTGFRADVVGRSSAFLPLKDGPHLKEVMIAFLPYVKKGDQCEVNINWTWPRCMGQLRDQGEEEFEWVCSGFDNDCEGELHLEFVFDGKLGSIQCSNVGISPKDTQFNVQNRANETAWLFDVPRAPLGKGTVYRLRFRRA